jgi:nitrite reductase/ring-hydroxylating ferredoxin subunit
LAVGALGSAAGLLASCGSSSEDDSGPGSSTPSRALAGGSLAAVADIPVGGGKLVTAPDGTQIVLVRPSADDIKAYDAHCTHQQAIVNPPKGGRITCPRHGSQFDPANGNVLRDPARTPLKKIEVTVAGGQVKLA